VSGDLDAYRARTGTTTTLTGAGTNRTLELARGGGFDVDRQGFIASLDHPSPTLSEEHS
jgi:hypothetical protein